MTEEKPRVLLIPHEMIPESGSFEVRYPDGRPSDYFYFEDDPGRRVRLEVMTRAEAKKAAQAKARQAQETLELQRKPI